MYSERANDLARSRSRACVRSAAWLMALATPKSMIFGTGLPSCIGDQHVGGLDVAVDDAFLMGVLHGLADGDEQLQPLVAS